MTSFVGFTKNTTEKRAFERQSIYVFCAMKLKKNRTAGFEQHVVLEKPLRAYAYSGTIVWNKWFLRSNKCKGKPFWLKIPTTMYCC